MRRKRSFARDTDCHRTYTTRFQPDADHTDIDPGALANPRRRLLHSYSACGAHARTFAGGIDFAQQWRDVRQSESTRHGHVQLRVRALQRGFK